MPPRVTVDGDVLRVTLGGAGAVWALKRRVERPLAHVASARVGDRRTLQRQRPALRWPGTLLPGLITAGTYRSPRPGGGRQFWDVRRAERVLVVDLHDDAYSRLVLEVPDPAAVAATIDAATRARPAGARGRAVP